MISLSYHNYDDPTLKVCHTIRPCIDSIIDLAPDGAIYVESGGYLGNTTKYIIQKLLDSKKNFTYYVIDNWKLDNVTERHDDNLQFYKDNVGDLIQHVNIICSDALLAIDQFQDNSVYFCFLDDSHVYQHVTKQIKLWTPKLADYSFLVGDDYYSWEVSMAVHDHYDDKDITTIGDNNGFLIEQPKEKFKW